MSNFHFFCLYEAGGEETRTYFSSNLCLFEPSFGRSISHINLANVGEFGAGEETRQIFHHIYQTDAHTIFGFERENDGGEEIANFPSNLYGPNDGS